MAEGPELLGETLCFANCGRLVAICNNKHLRAQFGNIGERIADHYSGSQGSAVALYPLSFADEIAVATGLRDQFIAAGAFCSEFADRYIWPTLLREFPHEATKHIVEWRRPLKGPE